jgi:hypothetical protein
VLERLVQVLKEQFPRSVVPLTWDKYVDDIASGADSKEECEAQIWKTSCALSVAGFSMKFVAKSGDPPPADGSSDGATIGCLGVSWKLEADQLSLAHPTMNMNKKVRGQKAAPNRDLSTPSEIRRAFQDGLISKAGVLSQIAEFYDPTGWWEPFKLQMKISFQEFTPLDWDDKVPDTEIETWVKHFLLMEEIRKFYILRCIILSGVRQFTEDS